MPAEGVEAPVFSYAQARHPVSKLGVASCVLVRCGVCVQGLCGAGLLRVLRVVLCAYVACCVEWCVYCELRVMRCALWCCVVCSVVCMFWFFRVYELYWAAGLLSNLTC